MELKKKMVKDPKKKNRYSFLFVMIVIIASQTSVSCRDKWALKALPYNKLGLKDENLKKALFPRKNKIQSIIIHSTNHYNAGKYLKSAHQEGMMVHLLITSKGNLYGLSSPQDFKTLAAPQMDEGTIHVAFEGMPSGILRRKKQVQKGVEVINKIAKEFKVPLTNYDISSKKGIFTHTQSKIKYGGFIKIYPEDGGQGLLAKILKKMEGKFYTESKWKDRHTVLWAYRRENRNLIRSRGKLSMGAGLTKSPKTLLKCAEQTKDGKLKNRYRIKYVDRGKIKPSCIVLHFSGSGSFYSTKRDLERRKLSATFIIDEIGRVLQVMDSLEDKPAAATGTNNHCMQAEITGRGETDLLKNRIQMEKVAVLLKELSKKFKFPLNNYDIASHKGVFSHTQAKKRWGQSVWIMGDDFDPGENYMKKVIELSGGKYYPEKDWKGRKSLDWAILHRKFQP